MTRGLRRDIIGLRLGIGPDPIQENEMSTATQVRTDPKPATTPDSRKLAIAAILPRLQAAKSAHMAAWRASQVANQEYTKLRDEYSAICGLVRRGK